MHQPRSNREFFDALGAGYVTRALIDGEFKGETKRQAEIWLREENAKTTRKLAIITLILTTVVTVGGIALQAIFKF